MNGRKPKMTDDQRRIAKKWWMLYSQMPSKKEMCELLGVHPQTLMKSIRDEYKHDQR